MIGMGRPLATTPRRGDRSPGAGASAAGISRERGAGEVEGGSAVAANETRGHLRAAARVEETRAA
jgi:hypothetical protein